MRCKWGLADAQLLRCTVWRLELRLHYLVSSVWRQGHWQPRQDNDLVILLDTKSRHCECGVRQYHGVCKIYSARWLSGIDDGSGAVRAYRKPKEVVCSTKGFCDCSTKGFRDWCTNCYSNDYPMIKTTHVNVGLNHSEISLFRTSLHNYQLP